MSFAGSAKRIWQMTWVENPILKWALAVPVALAAILMAWMLVVVWYGIFGLLLVPYRLIRRGDRKRKVEAVRHREQLAMMERQQMLATQQLLSTQQHIAVQQQQQLQTPNRGQLPA
jgi:hypothetical protein